MRLLELLGRYDLGSLERFYEHKSAVLTADRRRKSSPICVIDDQVFHQIGVLRDHGFDIVQIGDISSITNVDEFDIIACDLRGVGSKFSSKLQGSAIIQEIKKYRPEKFVIAYSGSFDRSNMAKIAHDSADRKIAKSADIDKWIDILDEAVQLTTDPIEKWKKVRTALVERNVSSKHILRLEGAYCKAIVKGDKFTFEREATRINILEDVRPIVQGLVASAIWATLN